MRCGVGDSGDSCCTGTTSSCGLISLSSFFPFSIAGFFDGENGIRMKLLASLICKQLDDVDDGSFIRMEFANRSHYIRFH